MDASVTFLTPAGLLLTLAVLVPLAAVLLVRRRARSARAVLGLREPRLRRLAVAVAAIVAAGVLVGLAAAQPILERPASHLVRTDAEVFVVIDVSRSMLAQDGQSSPMRIERAKDAASAVREALPSVRVGIASLSDRVLPHMFPSPDANVFEATLERSIGIEQPPPRSGYLGNVTKIGSLATIRGFRFFSPETSRRVVVVLTDGETLPVGLAGLGRAMQRPPRIDTVFVHLWGADERVFSNDAPEPGYEPDTSSRESLDRVAAATGGTVYSGDEVGAATRRVVSLVADGPTVVEGEVGDRLALAPYLAAAAFLPFVVFVWRRDR